MNWLFVAGHAWLPPGDPLAAGLGGTEQAVIALTAALADRGHDVRVAGASPTLRRLGGVAWLPPMPPPSADVTIAINDANLLPTAARLPAVWFHNEVEFWRETRKRRLGALWHHRPAAVFIGTEQARLASRLLPLRARATIPYGVADRVLQADPAATPPGPHAVFTSQAYRGLREVIALWRRHVAPRVPAARLSALVAASDVAGYRALAGGEPSVDVRARIGNGDMLDLLRSARVLIAPGHRSETFCMAAAEAVAMGVPIVSHGTGSLKERVADGRTGTLCGGDWAVMGARIAALLTDDALWSGMHRHGLASRETSSWRPAAARWEAWAQDLLARPRKRA